MNTPSLVSSSSTLWATASKEWIVPAKPKPGRKPKKDVTPQPNLKDDDDVDSKGRRIQNRAAQRAFRERKQSQLAELQARVQSYEQGEIGRNVALQNMAKRLKEENENLRRENAMLKELLVHERDISKEKANKRWRDNSPIYSGDYPAKKPKPTCESRASIRHTLPFAPAYPPSPPSMASSPDSNECSENLNPFSPNPFDSRTRNPIIFSTQQSSLSNILDFSPRVKSNFEPGGAFPTFDCGFCNDDTPCVCREFAMQQAAADCMCAASQVHLKMENFEQNTIASNIDQPEVHLSAPQAARQISILDNLPAYQPPVPLRRRTVVSNSNTVFPISAPSSASGNCSGDPGNCMACADDSFGMAFCAAVSEAAASTTPCMDCSCSVENMPVADATTRDAYGDRSPRSRSISHPVSTLNAQHGSETIPTNTAWRQLKAHPNIAFSDLSLLAEVVARRTKCTGPRVTISPASGSFTPERTVSPPIAEKSRDIESDRPVHLTDPHARHRDEQIGASSSPSLVSNYSHAHYVHQRVREVHTDAVRDALRLLDAKFTRP